MSGIRSTASNAHLEGSSSEKLREDLTTWHEQECSKGKEGEVDEVSKEVCRRIYEVFENRLKTLSFSGLPVNSFPDCIGKLSSLEHLDISGTWVRVFPATIEELKNLRTLNIYDTIYLSSKSLFELVNLPKECKIIHEIDLTELERTDLALRVLEIRARDKTKGPECFVNVSI